MAADLVIFRREGHVTYLKWCQLLTFGFNQTITYIGVYKMGKCKGSEKLGRMVTTVVSAYQFSLLLSPVVSVWECIVRKMRYSFRPEWV
ncbi:hypothetical protein RJ639_030126 [Escallonia herrerae]|uniref:Uncharacterized protein n=1 Tax=Escallonia herrerae TaxID=1293975 RepID=A0AA88WZM9_9ASTE|nr:hypothetical protein RJ639_030126 [Escallonia herrerae]